MLLYGRLTVPACNDRSVLLVVVVTYVVDLSMEFRYHLDLSLQPVRVWDILERRDSTPCLFRLGSQYLSDYTVPPALLELYRNGLGLPLDLTVVKQPELSESRQMQLAGFDPVSYTHLT